MQVHETATSLVDMGPLPGQDNQLILASYWSKITSGPSSCTCLLPNEGVCLDMMQSNHLLITSEGSNLPNAI